jgi:hypothetical protein
MLLNVGLSRKVGLPDYGSLGCSCNVQVELPANLVFDDLEAFHRQVKSAYVACSQAIGDELGRHQRAEAVASGNGHRASEDDAQQGSTTAASPPNGQGNGHNQANGNGHRNGHRISEKQLTYIRQLGGQIKGLGVRRLDSIADKMFSKPLADLSSLDGSGLIDVLKDVKAGKIDLDSVLTGGVA